MTGVTGAEVGKNGPSRMAETMRSLLNPQHLKQYLTVSRNTHSMFLKYTHE